MRTRNNGNAGRVGMYLDTHTRNRLNKLKADLTLETGKTMSQDDVIVILLNHFAKTAPMRPERVLELVG